MSKCRRKSPLENVSFPRWLSKGRFSRQSENALISNSNGEDQHFACLEWSTFVTLQHDRCAGALTQSCEFQFFSEKLYSSSAVEWNQWGTHEMKLLSSRTQFWLFCSGKLLVVGRKQSEQQTSNNLAARWRPRQYQQVRKKRQHRKEKEKKLIGRRDESGTINIIFFSLNISYTQQLGYFSICHMQTLVASFFLSLTTQQLGLFFCSILHRTRGFYFGESIKLKLPAKEQKS